MTLTETSMHEAFFPVVRAENQCSVPACEAFPCKNEQRNLDSEEAAKQSTQKPPEVTGFENRKT